MTREEAIVYGKDYYRDLITACCEIDEKHKEFVRMAIQALSQEPTGQFDYVPIRDAKGISCTECKYFKVTQEPLRGMGGLIDLGQARCEKHDLIKDFAHHGQFKNLKPCEYYEDFKEGDKE